MGCPGVYEAGPRCSERWRVRRRRNMMQPTTNSRSSKSPTPTSTPIPALAPVERLLFAGVELLLGEGDVVVVPTFPPLDLGKLRLPGTCATPGCPKTSRHFSRDFLYQFDGRIGLILPCLLYTYRTSPTLWPSYACPTTD